METKAIELFAIKKRKLDIISKISISFFALFIFVILVGIIVFIIIQGWKGFEEIFSSKRWDFTSYYGVLPLLVGTIFITLISCIISLPLAVFTSLFINEFLPKKLKIIANSLIELLAGIPSVIYGFFGIMFFVGNHFLTPSVLLAGIILSFMVLPNILHFTNVGIKSIPTYCRDGSLALGANRTETVFKIILPGAKKGITAGLMMGLARAIGETIAVTMLIGNTANLPSTHDFFTHFFSMFLLFPNEAMSSAIATNFLEATPEQAAILYAVACVLFVLVTIFNLISIFYLKKDATKSMKKIHVIKLFIKATFNKFKISKKKKHKNNQKRKDVVYAKKFNSFKTSKSSQTFKNNITNRLMVRKAKMTLRFSLLLLMSFISIGFVLLILFYIIINGFRYFRIDMLWSAYNSKNPMQGGMAPFIVTTLMLLFITIVLAIPCSLALSLYLTEFSKKNKKNQFCRTFINVLNSTPSILFGMLGMTVFVLLFKIGSNGFSILAGGLTLTFIVIPTLTLSMISAIETIPPILIENSYAMGATKWQTISKVILPCSLKHMTGGIILSISRVIGESAPVFLTIGASVFMPTGFLSQGRSLVTCIYLLFTEGKGQDAQNFIYCLSLVVMFLVLIINIMAKLTIYYIHKDKKTKVKKITNSDNRKYKNIVFLRKGALNDNNK